MADLDRMAADAEAPVNPYSLLEAVNASSDTAHTAWLIFLGVMTYLLVAVAGVTHKDLLLNNDIILPVLQVKIELTRFFLFAPILLVLFHMGVVAQLVLLARKTLELDQALLLLEATDRRTHPLRLELHNFFFVQAVAGPERSRVMSTLLHGMSWLTLVILPVLLILYVQGVFLPYHHRDITAAHRFALVADMVMLVTIGIFLLRAETSFFRAFWRTLAQHPVSFLLTTLVLAFVSVFSFFVATIPGEGLDRFVQRLPRVRANQVIADDRSLAAYTMPFFGATRDGRLFGLFSRHLDVTDIDLVVDKDVGPGERSVNLRGRDLRYAALDRTDLHQADFTGANLEGATFSGANLKGAWLGCADLAKLTLGNDRRAARCTNARGADLGKAMLAGSHLAGIDLTAAKLEEANLEAAELAFGMFAGANFTGAHLERADLTGVAHLEGANFLQAHLQGANLDGARLHFADLSHANLQGASFVHAQLYGAILREADLEGADLGRARLQGADLTGARLRGADLREARVWQALPPTAAPLLDAQDLLVAPLDKAEAMQVAETIRGLDDAAVRAQVQDALAPLLSDNTTGWAQSPDRQRWLTLAAGSADTTGDSFRARLTDHLTRLMCQTRWNGPSVAAGIAKRAQAPQFKGDLAVVHDRLKAKDCPVADTMPARVMRDLGTRLEQARGQ